MRKGSTQGRLIEPQKIKNAEIAMINVVKTVQEKVTPTTGSRTMQHQILEGPLTCLSVNRECSQVVVAGRNVFKVFLIEEDAFTEKCNLRVGKNLNLNFSALDVMWNPVEDHLLASAATNGAVVLWNLNKSSRSKQETVFLEHKRTVHKVCFHGNEPHLLMSGAQDGLMMLFDLRTKKVASVFNGRSECVRDVQFSPHHYFIFGSAFENGNIQLWDMRNPLKAEKQFTAHNGPAFSIDWHPQEKHWLGTAGRDKLIKVWDTQNISHISPVKSIYSVQTIASVARIKWRPQRQYHIASCALLLDFAINVWDVRRPYIPFASFNEHLDVVTGIVWKQNDPHIFLSSSRDSTLYQHVFRDATRPADNANPVSVDISITGNVAHASCDKLAPPPAGKTAFKITQIPPIFRQRAPDRTEQFTTVASSLSEFDTDSLDEALSLDWFVESALSYKLTGRPLSELCEHNARVALGLKRLQVAQTWNMLKHLYTSTPAASSTATQSSIGTLGGKTPDHKDSTDRGKLTMGSKQHHDSKSSKIDPEIKEAHGDMTTDEDESDVPEVDVIMDTNLSHIASGMGNDNHSDFFFGDGDVDQTSFEYDNLEHLPNGGDWDLPNEAFQLRHVIGEQGTLPDPIVQKTQDSPSSANESDYGVVVEKVNRNVEKNIREDILAIKPFISTVPSMDFTELVVDVLRQYAEKTDIQMAVTALIVLDEKIRPHIDDATQEQWFTSYIDLLGRFKLWTVATAIIKLSKLPAVSDLNQRSTRIQTNCSKCLKPLQRTGWLCDRCKAVNICSICHLPVKGIYVWCQGCSHGGHLQHIQEWLIQWKQCPAGCGHLCEYTQQDSFSTHTVPSIKTRATYPNLQRWS